MVDLSMLKFQGVQGESTKGGSALGKPQPIGGESTRWDYLVSLQGIRGESRVAGYAGWIPVLSFSHTSRSGGGGRQAPVPVIRCEALAASHSSRLYMAYANGTRFPSATIAVLRNGTKYITVAMTDVCIASVKPPRGSGGPGVEEFDLDSSNIIQSYH
jgi:type VI protein secretion system component Hcp